LNEACRPYAFIHLFKHEMKLGATKSASKHKKYKFTLGGKCLLREVIESQLFDEFSK